MLGMPSPPGGPSNDTLPTLFRPPEPGGKWRVVGSGGRAPGRRALHCSGSMSRCITGLASLALPRKTPEFDRNRLVSGSNPRAGNRERPAESVGGDRHDAAERGGDGASRQRGALPHPVQFHRRRLFASSNFSTDRTARSPTMSMSKPIRPTSCMPASPMSSAGSRARWCPPGPTAGRGSMAACCARASPSASSANRSPVRGQAM